MFTLDMGVVGGVVVTNAYGRCSSVYRVVVANDD
jgi:hypothetical protein